MLPIQRWAPSLHTVAVNPLQELLGSPRDAWWFALVVVAAGGVREEIQRAFLLHRFSIWLGGPAVGLAVTSIAFGAGHLMQGVDATIATGVLGAFWGAIYLQQAILCGRRWSATRASTWCRSRRFSPSGNETGTAPLKRCPTYVSAELAALRTRLEGRVTSSYLPDRYKSITSPRRRSPAIQSSRSA